MFLLNEEEKKHTEKDSLYSDFVAQVISKEQMVFWNR